MIAVCDSKVDFKAERVERTATFTVNAPVDVAFPLFGPIKEKLWASGWEPEIVYSITNDVELQMIFKTKSSLGEPESYLWVINQYRPDEFLVEYTVSTTQRIWFITVKCDPEDAFTQVTVTYSYTGLTEEGNQLNRTALERMYAHNLTDWAEAINFYLKTGKQLKPKL
jgi:hypothetical protein